MARQPDIEQQAWDRQPGEPMLWYERFVAYYLALPAHERTFTEAYNRYMTSGTRAHGEPDEPEQADGEAAEPPERKKVSGRWKEAYERYEWRNRAEARDLWQMRRDAQQEELDRVRVRARRRRILDKLNAKIEEAIDKVAVTTDARELARLVQVGLQEERTEYDDVPEHRVRTTGNVTVATVSANEVAELTPDEVIERGRQLATVFAVIAEQRAATAQLAQGLDNPLSQEDDLDP